VLSGTVVDGNRAGRYGGGISNGGGLSASGGTITGNSAVHGGSGLREDLSQGPAAVLTSVTVTGNWPDNCEPAVTVTGCTG
jgi:hypothetical protein